MRFACFLFFIWTVSIAFFASYALAHEAASGWEYPISCCSGYDCREVEDATVKPSATGYIVPSGEVVPFRDRRIRHSPDGKYHWCTHRGLDTGRTICLFIPPPST